MWAVLFLLACYWQGALGKSASAPVSFDMDCRIFCEDDTDVVVSADYHHRNLMMPFYFTLFVEYQEKTLSNNAKYQNLFELRGLDANNNDHSFLSVYIKPGSFQLEIGHDQQIVLANGPVVDSTGKSTGIDITMFNGDITLTSSEDNTPKTVSWTPEIDLSQTYYQLYTTTPDTTVTDTSSTSWPVIENVDGKLKYFRFSGKI
jgi:hypothetical protein